MRLLPLGAMAAVTAAGGLDDRQVGSGVGATAYAPGGGVALQWPSPMVPLELLELLQL